MGPDRRELQFWGFFHTVWPRMTKFGVITYREWRVLGVSHTYISYCTKCLARFVSDSWVFLYTDPDRIIILVSTGMSTLPDRASTAIRWIAPPLLTNTIRQTSSLCPGTECTTSIELPRKCSNCWHTHLSHFLSVEYYFRLQSRSSYVSDSCKTDDVRCQSIYVHYENSPSPSLSFTRNRCPINAQWWRWWRWVWKSRDGWRVVQRCAALLCPRPHRAEALGDDARLTSLCRVYRA